jgi:hypothetical protein
MDLKNKKRKRLVQPRQALEGLTVKSFFDFIGRTETSRGARRWSWIKTLICSYHTKMLIQFPI